MFKVNNKDNVENVVLVLWLLILIKFQTFFGVSIAKIEQVGVCYNNYYEMLLWDNSYYDATLFNKVWT